MSFLRGNAFGVCGDDFSAPFWRILTAPRAFEIKDARESDGVNGSMPYCAGERRR